MKLHYEVEWELDDEFINDVVDEVETVIKQFPDSDVDECIPNIVEDRLSVYDDCDDFNMDSYIDDVVEEVKHRYYDRKQKSTTIPPLPSVPAEVFHSGYVRQIDDLGRICVPKEFRDILKIETGGYFEFFFNNQGNIILKKYPKQD